MLAVRWGFNRFFTTTFPTASAGFDLTHSGPAASLAAVTPNPAFPAITMSDLASFRRRHHRPGRVLFARFQQRPSRNSCGRHSLKAGFDFRTLHDAGTPASGPTSLGFTDVFTRETPQTATAGTGASLATLLLGYPTSGSMNVVTNFDDFVRYYGGFVQDDFRVTRS